MCAIFSPALPVIQMFMTQNNAFRLKIMPVAQGIISCCPLSPSARPVLCHRESLCRFWLSPLPALARHGAVYLPLVRSRFCHSGQHISKPTATHIAGNVRQAFDRHTTSKNHGENDDCQRSAMLIHPSGKLFNPRKVKPKTGRQETITLAPGLTARLNAQPSRRGSTEP